MKISRDVLVAIVLYVSYARASYLPCYSWFSVGSKYSCVQLNKGYNLYYRVESGASRSACRNKNGHVELSVVEQAVQTTC